MSVVTDINLLVNDLLAVVPEACYEWLKVIGIGIVQLICMEQEDFEQATVVIPGPWSSETIWQWIKDWRVRNNLQNVTVVDRVAEFVRDGIQDTDNQDQDPLPVNPPANTEGELASPADADELFSLIC